METIKDLLMKIYESISVGMYNDILSKVHNNVIVKIPEDLSAKIYNSVSIQFQNDVLAKTHKSSTIKRMYGISEDKDEGSKLSVNKQVKGKHNDHLYEMCIIL